MSNYQKYPTLSGQRADLARRVGNLESDQALIARIADLEARVAALNGSAPAAAAPPAPS